MSEISKERLENYGSGSWYPDADYVKAMARELLALRERAEPVAWISESNLKALARGHRSVYVKNEPILTRPVALYTAPPAPVVKPLELPDVSAAKYYTEDGAFKAFDYKRDLNSAMRAAPGKN